MCQFCRLAALANRQPKMRATSKSLSSWGTLTATAVTSSQYDLIEEDRSERQEHS